MKLQNKTEAEFWRATYVATVRAGHAHHAAGNADGAIKALRGRQPTAEGYRGPPEPTAAASEFA